MWIYSGGYLLVDSCFKHGCCLLLGVDCWLVFGLCCALWGCGGFVNSVVLLNSLNLNKIGGLMV